MKHTLTARLILLVLIMVSLPINPLRAADDVGDFSIPGVMPLGDAALGRLRALVEHDAQAERWEAELRTQTQPLIDGQPNPSEVIHYQGLVNNDPLRLESVKHIREMADVALLLRYWQATQNPAAAETLKRFIRAWSATYRPTGNDVNENKLYPLLIAYLGLRDTFADSERDAVDRWVQELGDLHLQAVGQSTHFTNRFSKHIRLLAIAGLILDRQAWTDQAREGIKRYVEQGLRPDGSSLDLERRDSLDYHCSGLRPMVQLAAIIGVDGESLYQWESPDGSSLKKSVDFVLPYATGEKVHLEWVNTKSQLDRDRDEAGIESYRAGRPYDPREASRLLQEASYFDPTGAHHPQVGRRDCG